MAKKDKDQKDEKDQAQGQTQAQAQTQASAGAAGTGDQVQDKQPETPETPATETLGTATATDPAPESDLMGNLADPRTAYNGYRDHTGGVSLVSGQPIPEYDALPEPIKEAWGAAARAVAKGFASRLMASGLVITSAKVQAESAGLSAGLGAGLSDPENSTRPTQTEQPKQQERRDRDREREIPADALEHHARELYVTFQTVRKVDPVPPFDGLHASLQEEWRETVRALSRL